MMAHKMKKKMIYLRFFVDHRAISMTFWAVFFAFVLMPLMALSIELGRYFFVRSEIAKAADAAALAAVAEIDQRLFEYNGTLQPTSQTWANAQMYAGLNDVYLENLGIHAFVTGIRIVGSTVQVQVSADLIRLFPSVTPDIVVSETGQAEIRAFIQ